MRFEALQQPWMVEASCLGTDPDAFFPDSYNYQGNSTTLAIRVCNRCPVQQQCLDYALNLMDEPKPIIVTGIWGGTSRHQRYLIKQQQRRQAS